MSQPYVVESFATPAQKPPSVSFELSEDHRTLHAREQGGEIIITKQGEGVSRIELWDITVGRRVVQLDLMHPTEPAYDEWRDEVVYVCEVACALYWSMWRNQQLRAAAAAVGAES